MARLNGQYSRTVALEALAGKITDNVESAAAAGF